MSWRAALHTLFEMRVGSRTCSALRVGAENGEPAYGDLSQRLCPPAPAVFNWRMSAKPASGTYRLEIPDPPGGVRTDMSAWPVAVVIPPTSPMNDPDYCAYLEWTRKHIVCAGQPYAMVIDSRKNPPITAQQRKILAEHMKLTRPYSQKYCAGVAMVFESAIMRGVMTALFWMVQPPYTVKVFSTVEEARHWCKQRLDNFVVGSNAAATG